MNSIFQRSNPAIEKLFAEAGSPKKVMCIPIDYTHVVRDMRAPAVSPLDRLRSA